jgi:hypothetical protein
LILVAGVAQSCTGALFEAHVSSTVKSGWYGSDSHSIEFYYGVILLVSVPATGKTSLADASHG